MRHTFKKHEKLKKRKEIQDLFRTGKNLISYPLALRYLPQQQADGVHRAAFTVSKKHFKKAVQRNLLKRRMREAYRLNKHLLPQDGPAGHGMLFIYLAKTEADYASIEKATLQLFGQLSNLSR